MAGRVCVQFKDRRKASPLYPEEAILLPQTHRTMPFEQLLPELVKEFWYSLSAELDALPDELPVSVKGTGLSINGHRAPKSGRICDLVTGDGPVNVVVTVAGAESHKVFDRNGPVQTARADAEPRVPQLRQTPHKPVAARGAAAVPRPLPLANGAAKKNSALPLQPVPAFMPGMLNLSKAKRTRAPEDDEVEIPATEAIEALVNADLQYVMSRCATPNDSANGGAQMFTATWLPMKPTYQRASGVKRGKYRKKGEVDDEAGANGEKEPPQELTEEELAEKKRFRRERAKAACAKRWALARERKEAIQAGLLDPTVEAAKKEKTTEKEFRTMKLAKPLPHVVAIPRLARSENKASVIARALAEHGGVGFTCGICGAKLTSKESAVEHHKKSKKCSKQREEIFKAGGVAGGNVPAEGATPSFPSDVDASTAGKLVTQGSKRLSDLSVAELKAECGARGLSNQGKKSELRTRVLNDINHSTFTQQPLPAVMQAQAIMAQVQQLHQHHHHILAAAQQQQQQQQQHPYHHHHHQSVPLSTPLPLSNPPHTLPHHPIPHHHQPQQLNPPLQQPQPQPHQPVPQTQPLSQPLPRQHVFTPHANSQFVGFQPHTQPQFVTSIRSQPPAISPAQ